MLLKFKTYSINFNAHNVNGMTSFDSKSTCTVSRYFRVGSSFRYFTAANILCKKGW